MWVWGLSQCTLTPYAAQVCLRTSVIPKLWANKYGEVGMMANPSAHPQDMNVLKRTLYMFEVGVGTIPCGAGASDNAP